MYLVLPTMTHHHGKNAEEHAAELANPLNGRPACKRGWGILEGRQGTTRSNSKRQPFSKRRACTVFRKGRPGTIKPGEEHVVSELEIDRQLLVQRSY